jgi:hypothetical protein
VHPSGGVLGFFEEILGRGVLGIFEEILGSAPLPTVRECQFSFPSFRGALQHYVPDSGGALGCLRKSWVVEKNQGKIPLISGVGWIRI